MLQKVSSFIMIASGRHFLLADVENNFVSRVVYKGCLAKLLIENVDGKYFVKQCIISVRMKRYLCN